MQDIHETYKHLEQHTGDPELRAALAKHSNDALFLNTDSVHTLGNWTWRSASQLYICAGFMRDGDSPENNYWGVRKFLETFKRLLHLAGVTDVKAAKSQALPIPKSDNEVNSMCGIFNELRVKTQLTDVTFIANNDDSESRVQLHAHRIFLASRSPYFQQLFCPSFEDAKLTSEPIIVHDCGVNSLKETIGEAISKPI